VKKWLNAALEDIVGRLQAPGAGFGIIGGSFRVAQTKRSDAVAMFSPELEEKVTADGDSDQGGAADAGIIHNTRDVCGMLGHRGGTFADSGFTMPTEIGQDQPIAGCERFGDRHPEFMMRWKGMKKDNRRTIAEDPVDDFGVIAVYMIGGHRSH